MKKKTNLNIRNHSIKYCKLGKLIKQLDYVIAGKTYSKLLTANTNGNTYTSCLTWNWNTLSGKYILKVTNSMQFEHLIDVRRTSVKRRQSYTRLWNVVLQCFYSVSVRTRFVDVRYVTSYIRLLNVVLRTYLFGICLNIL